MSRKTVTFEIEGREKAVELRELTVQEIIDLMQGDYDNSLKGFQSIFQKFLPLCSNLKFEDLRSMAPSEIQLIWNKFKDVNKSFLEVSQQVGLNKLLGNLKAVVLEAVTKDFSNLLVDLSKKGIPEHSVTDIPSSSTH